MKISDLLTEAKSNRLSAEKLAFNTGMVALTVTFIWDAFHGGLSAEKIVAFGGVVMFGRVGTKWIDGKYDKPADTSNQNMEADIVDSSFVR